MLLGCNLQCPHPGIDISKHSKSLLLKHRQGAAKIHIDGPKAEPESSHQGQSVNVSKYISHQGSVDVVAVSPSLVLEDPHTAITPLGGSINLILSFDQPTPVPSQPQGSQEQKETFETVHRVSTHFPALCYSYFNMHLNTNNAVDHYDSPCDRPTLLPILYCCYLHDSLCYN